MSNAKQTSVNKERTQSSKEGRKKSEKGFMDYAIWVDFPVNAAILAFIVIKIIRVFQTGLSTSLEQMEQGLVITGKEKLDGMIVTCAPLISVYIALAVVVETIYLILKLRGKQPFITERYAIGIIIGKVIWIAFFIAAALLF